MCKVWSISTTIRNPKRIPGFLSVAKKLEGEVWDEEGQVKYQTLLIMYKEYEPNGCWNQLSRIPDDLDDKENYNVAYDIANNIMDIKGYTDKPMRGRQSLNTLRKMQLVSIDNNNNNKLQVTDLGNELLNESIDLGDVLLKFNFKSIEGIDVNPLILTLEFLVELNKMMKGNSWGITKKEFKYYVMTISRWNQVNDFVDELIKGRNDESYGTEYENMVEDKYVNFNNIKDYSDSALRYLATSKYIVFGKNDNNKKCINFNEEWLDKIENIIEDYHGEKNNC